MIKREIFMALSADDNHARGNIWKITAKKTDFYLDFEGRHGGGFHLSMHAPSEHFDGHRFHIRINKTSVKAARAEASFVEHAIGRGHQFAGVQLADEAYHVARLRWNWDLQRPRFRQAALSRTPVPQLGVRRDGKMLNTLLAPNSAWDIDFVIAYGEPYWPDPDCSDQKSSRIGPLVNGAGMWLTATSYHRSQVLHPSPKELQLPVPRLGEAAQAIMNGGPGPLGVKDIYWFVEGITSKELLANTAASRGRDVNWA